MNKYDKQQLRNEVVRALQGVIREAGETVRLEMSRPTRPANSVEDIARVVMSVCDYRDTLTSSNEIQPEAANDLMDMAHAFDAIAERHDDIFGKTIKAQCSMPLVFFVNSRFPIVSGDGKLRFLFA